MVLLILITLFLLRFAAGGEQNFSSIADTVISDWIVSEQTITVQGNCFPLKCTHNTDVVATTFKLYTAGDVQVGTVKVKYISFDVPHSHISRAS
jgi:hypothetical protein